MVFCLSVQKSCAPQKVDPALIAPVRPTIVGCFWPVFFFAGHNSHRKRGETDRPRLRSTTPALDPTALAPPWPSRKHRHYAAGLWSISKGPSFGTGRECLSKLILFGEKPLRHALREYIVYYHHERNHQDKENLLLFPASKQLPQSERRYAPVNGLAGCYVSTIGKPHEYFDLTVRRQVLIEPLR